jgi:hypothetical protein
MRRSAVLPLVCLIVVAGCGGDPPTGEPPDVFGFTVDEAKATLEEAGWNVEEDDQSDTFDFKAENNVVCTVQRQGEGEVLIVIKSECDRPKAKATAQTTETPEDDAEEGGTPFPGSPAASAESKALRKLLRDNGIKGVEAQETSVFETGAVFVTLADGTTEAEMQDVCAVLMEEYSGAPLVTVNDDDGEVAVDCN